MTTAAAASRTVSIDTTSRIGSIDVVRGAVMVIMAIDHVRVYSGLPAGGPTAGIFFTRWVTHFCAPAFLFLAGTSAFLYGMRHQDLSRHLVVRGLWLVLLELTVLRLAWTFNVDFAQYEMAGVIWVIGWCMILMAALVQLPVNAIAAIGLVIVVGHNLLDSSMGRLVALASSSSLGGVVKIVYVGFFAGPLRGGSDGPNLIVLYSIVPWIGVMAVGYAFGRIVTRPPMERQRACIVIGLAMTALFIVLRGWNLYGDPNPWAAPPSGVQRNGPAMPAFLAFLNTNKYPASLSFLLMTLGPTIAALGLVERARGAVTRWLTVFGRVPFFYYVVHIPLIHAMAIVVSLIRTGDVNPWLFANHPMGNPPPPARYAWSLALLYLVWAVVVLVLYFACRWFGAVRRRRSDWWLAYL